MLVGAGGHCRACIDVLNSSELFRVAAIVGLDGEIGVSVAGNCVEYTDNQLPVLVERYSLFLVTIGQIKTSEIRRSVFESVLVAGGVLPNIVSRTAYAASDVSLGKGTIVMHHAMINTGSSIGDNCIVNSKALVEHDCFVGDHCHLSTGSILNGQVRVGEGCFIGSGAVVHQSVSIGENSVVAAGAVVRKDVPDGTIVR